VFDCAGFPKTYKDAIRIVQRGGTVVLLGVHFENVPISFLELIIKEVNLRGSFGYSLEEFKEMITLLSQKKIQTNLIVSKKVKLENAIDEGFHELLRPDRKAAKILVEI
ncbi:MAG: zinc-binding dehydrogenase, partial [Candidatus Helarchaeota archaeon]|nr:zinc-binding dehydrogenase [Candidatus Helarchaeota archaeon]